MKSILGLNKSLLLLSIKVLFIANYIKLFVAQDSSEKNSIFDKINAHRISTKSDLEKLLDETDLTYLAYYYKKDSPNSNAAAQFLLNTSEKLNYLAGIILIDCGADENEAKKFERCKPPKEANEADFFPVITLLVPPELKFNPYTKKFNKHYERQWDRPEFSENLVYNFITNSILNRGMKLNSDNVDDFLGNQEYNKLVLFTDKKQTPLIFRGLSNHYFNQLLFGEVEKDQEKLIKRFNVKSFPTLMVYKTQEDSDDLLEEPVVQFYQGKINAKDIAEFLSEYALKQKKYLEGTQNYKSAKNLLAKLIKEITPQELKNASFFEKNKNKQMILFLNSDSNLHSEKLKNLKNLSEAETEAQNALFPESLKKLFSEASGFFYFYRLNCLSEADAAFCRESFKAKALPALALLRGASLEKAELLPLEAEELQAEMLRLFPSEISFVNPQNLQMNLQLAINQNKVPLMYFYQDAIPLGLHLISHEGKYKQHVELMAFEAPPKEMLTNFQVSKLPELVIVLNDPSNPGSARLIKYGNEINYVKLKKFLSMNFESVQKASASSPKKEEETAKKELELISSNKSLEELCLKTNKKLCLIAFLDAKENEASKKSFENSMKIYKEIHLKNLNKPYNFGWVNATCHESFSSLFNVNSASLPNIIAYVPSREVYSGLVGTFDSENIEEFIDKVIKGKANFYRINKDLIKMPDIKCEEIKDIAENLEEDEILKEILEEERKKREELEKQRELEAAANKGKKRGKKKKKKDL